MARAGQAAHRARAGQPGDGGGRLPDDSLLAASLTVLVGVGLNTVFGSWWADPVSALVIPYFLVREAREAWLGEDND